MDAKQNRSDGPSTTLGLWDTVSIVMGIVVGAAIFKVPPLVFGNVATVGAGLLVWLLGGGLCLVGALCYAELATTYPQSGGDYVYLSRAFGRSTGFLFGWAQLVAILTGSIGALAYVFGDYAVVLCNLPADAAAWLAMAAVLVLTAINMLGVAIGKTAHNLLTLAKVLGLAGVALCGLFSPVEIAPFDAAGPATGGSIGLALVLVLYAYGGWNDAVFVTAEVRRRQTNIPLALGLGIGGVSLIYLLVNLAYVRALGVEKLRAATAPAADVLTLAIGPQGGKVVSVLVMTSALGAVNGMIFTGSRLYARLGEDHTVFSPLRKWHKNLHSPVRSLVVQALVALGLVAAVGTQSGQEALDQMARWIAGRPLPWERFEGGFELLVAASAPVFWAFFFLTGLSLLVLRWREPNRQRPFRVPLFPILPLVFLAMCGYMLDASIRYAGGLVVLSLVPLVVGYALYWLFWRSGTVGTGDRPPG